MKFKDYQEKSKRTAIYPKDQAIYYLPLGLVGESGEIADKVKKVIRDEKGKLNENTKKEITKELGDVLWYLSQLATELDFSLEEIAQNNLNKLASRKKRNRLEGSGDNR